MEERERSWALCCVWPVVLVHPGPVLGSVIAEHGVPVADGGSGSLESGGGATDTLTEEG